MLLLADSTGGISNPQIAMLIGALALIWGILRWRKLTVNRQRRPAEERVVSKMANPLSVREVSEEIQALLADLEETSRRLTAQLDNRYTRLEQLMAEADEKIRRLEALTSAAGKSGGDTGIAAGSTPVAHVTEPLATEAQRTLARLRQERGAPPPALDPAYEPIYTLADRGKSSREIAQELGRQPGEIELILALRQHAG